MSLDDRGVVNRLAQLIDSDEPPGMAAFQLACTVVGLVQDRDPKTAVLIQVKLRELAREFPREGGG